MFGQWAVISNANTPARQQDWLIPSLLAVAKAPFRAAWLGDLAGAWIFYSVLPLPPGISPALSALPASPPGWRWCGTAGGAALVAAGGCGLVPQLALVLALGSWLSGGLHLDGAMDTADGLAAGQRCLEAMDDSRVGASGVQALLQLLLLRVAAWSLLAAGPLPALGLVWAALWGRIAPLLAMQAFPYLRATPAPLPFTGSTGAACCRSSGARSAAAGAHPWRGRLGWPWLGWLGLLPAVLVPWQLGRRLGGHSGDSYGACVEWSVELLLLGRPCCWGDWCAAQALGS